MGLVPREPGKCIRLSFLVAFCLSAGDLAGSAQWRQYDTNPFVIDLEIPAPADGAGSMIVADLTNDGRMDYLVTVRGHVAAWANDGRRLWVLKTPVRVGGSAERQGLPGHNAPGVQAADVDRDSATEVLFLTQDGALHIVSGSTGQEERVVRRPAPRGAEQWEHLVVGNFRGQGDCDLLLQATNAKGYRMGRFLAAWAWQDLIRPKGKPLWQRDDFLACAHNGARLADLDGDGRDEVLGGTIVSSKGKILYRIPLTGHIDSIYAADVRPDIPGLEVVALEEGDMRKKERDRVFLYNPEGLIWASDYHQWEPQNAAVGEFDPGRPGLEVWCRSRFNQHQKPFVFDARGEVVAHYEMDDVAPKGWTVEGVEVINTIDWTGGPRQLAAAKERHEAGDVAIFDPISGKFAYHFPTRAHRLYVADVSGDWREEVIVLSGSRLQVYHNEQPNPNPERPRLWTRNTYRRSKMTWNYYSP